LNYRYAKGQKIR